MIIYKATNSINNKSYIGKTSYNLDKRMKQHVDDALRGSTNMYFHKAIRKYGQENFIWDVLEECNTKEADKLETYYIGYYDTYNTGYNLTLGGDGNRRVYFTDKQKQEIIKLYTKDHASLREIAEKYNCSYRPIQRMLENNNITIRSSGIKGGGPGAFKKGDLPWNKGLKGIHLSPKTEFRKGMTPWNKGR